MTVRPPLATRGGKIVLLCVADSAGETLKSNTFKSAIVEPVRRGVFPFLSEESGTNTRFERPGVIAADAWRLSSSSCSLCTCCCSSSTVGCVLGCKGEYRTSCCGCCCCGGE